jgi:hypothetical protein
MLLKTSGYRMIKSGIGASSEGRVKVFMFTKTDAMDLLNA